MRTNKSPNPFKALTIQIHSMGYNYNLLSFFKNFFLFSIFIIILGYFHKLNVVLIVFLILTYLMLLPFSIYSQYKYLYEQKRFQELCIYLKQMKINFKTHKKIIIALKETLEIFESNDRIYPYIEQAISAIESGTDYRTALDIIEEPFKNSYITKLHAFMIQGELEGGRTVYQALDNIDYQSWQTDTTVFQTDKYKYQNQNSVYTTLGLVLSLSVVLVFQNIITGTGDVLVHIFSQTSYQIQTFIYILVDLVSYIFIKTLITEKWIREDE